jgi:hypothetical protein
VLDRLESVADHLPQIVQIGAKADEQIDFLVTAQQMLGMRDQTLYTDTDMQVIRERMQQINARVQQRAAQLQQLEAEAAAVATTTTGGAS